MTSSSDMPARSADSISPDPGPARPRGRRAAVLLTAAAPLTAAALASAPLAVAFPAAPPAAHASAALPQSDCLAPLAGQQAPKYPACLGD